MAFYDKFPYTNFQELNLDWIISALKLLEKEQKEFINNNVIKYADPIKWNITTQYEANTVVTDVNGNAYISSQPVPSGVNITNTAYWSKIGNFDELWGVVKDAITTANEGAGTTATASRTVNDLVWVQDKLLRVTAPMIAGDSYMIGSNCALTDIDDELITLRSNISGFTAALQAEVTARQQADTNLQNNITDLTKRLNSALIFNVKDYGAVGDGVTDDTTSIQKAMDAAMQAHGGTVILPSGDYFIKTVYIRPYNVADNPTSTPDINFLKMDRMQLVGVGQANIKSAAGGIVITDTPATGSGSYSNFFTEINNIRIETGGTTALDIGNALHTILSNCQIKNAGGTGIYLHGYGDVSILDNTVVAKICMYSNHAGDNLIQGNDFYSDNVCYQSDGYSGNTRIVSNTFTSLTNLTGVAIQLLDSVTGEHNYRYHIEGNSFDDFNIPVDVYHADDVYIGNNQFGNANTLIKAEDSKSLTVCNNAVTATTPATFANLTTSNINVHDNIIVTSGIGVLLNGCTGRFGNNDIQSTGGDAIVVSSAGQVAICENIFRYSDHLAYYVNAGSTCVIVNNLFIGFGVNSKGTNASSNAKVVTDTFTTEA